ncbi:MAG: NusG domain II-containing protein [Ruminiclostridium sp.]|nr:NusG domain II-containing protein [Ruminiclostridium sp.]
MKRTKIIIITVVCVLLAAAFVYAFIAFGGSSEKHIAEITSDGNVVRRIDLLTAPDETFTVHSGDGYNVVCVKDGTICVSEASCPDKICVHHGELKTELLPIVCMPNKLIITLV